MKLAAGTHIYMRKAGDLKLCSLKYDVQFERVKTIEGVSYGTIYFDKLGVRQVAVTASELASGFECRNCGRTLRQPKHTCPKCGSEDIDVRVA